MSANFVRLAIGFALLTLPTVLTGSATSGSLEALPLLAAVALGAWLSAAGSSHPSKLQQGLWVAILAGAAMVSVSAIVPVTRTELVEFFGHENIVAAHCGCLTLLAYYRKNTHRSRLLFIAGGLVACLALGSRSVAGPLFVVLVLTELGVSADDLARRRKLALSPAASVLVLTLGLGLAVLVVPTWRTQALDSLALLIPVSSSAPHSRNLVPASEALGRWPWSLEGVTVTESGVDGEGHSTFTITKVVGAASARSQFRLQLAPATSYTLSLALHSDDERAPGVTGWAPAVGEVGEAVVVAGYRSDGPPIVASSDPTGVQITFVSATAEPGGWVTLVLHMTNLGDDSRALWLGPTPDVRPGTAGASALFARFMVQEGAVTELVYTPTLREPEAQQTARSRLRIFSLALAGIGSAPWIGHGHGSFSQQQLAVSADGFAFAHAHNLALHVAFERGLVGIVGLTLLVAGLLRFSAPSWWAWNLTVIGVLLMNVTDMTFWGAGVTLPLGLALGSVVASVAVSERRTPATSEPRVE